MIEELRPKYGYRPENIEVEITGRRSGEKDYEKLIAEEEMRNAHESEDMFAITPEELGNITDLPIASSAKGRKSNEDDGMLGKDEIKTLIGETLST